MANLIGRWTFDGTTEDSSPVGNDAVFNSQMDYDGNRAEFDGNDDFTTIPDTSAYNTPDATIAIDFTLASLSGKNTLISRGTDNDDAGAFRVYFDGDDELKIEMSDGSDRATFDADSKLIESILKEDTDHKLVISFDASAHTVGLYLDGVKVLDQETSNSEGIEFDFGAGSDDILLGAWNDDGDIKHEMDGTMDLVEFYDAAMTAEELEDAQTAPSVIHDLTDGSDQGEILGTDDDDTMWGGPAEGQADGGLVIDDEMEGFGGDDIMMAGDGDDTVLGGQGNDQIDAGAGADLAAGGLGDDLIKGGSGDDELHGDGDIPGFVSNAVDVGSLSMQPGKADFGTEVGDASNADNGASIHYTDAATLPNGDKVTLKLTLVGKSDPGLRVNLVNGTTDQTMLLSGDKSLAGETAEMKVEFFNQTTGEPLILNGTATFSDIDLNSGNVQPEQVILDAASFTAFGVDTGSSLTIEQSADTASAKGSESNSPGDQDAWFSAKFEGQSEISFTLVYPGSDAGFGFNGKDITNEVVTPVSGGDDTIFGGEGDDTIYGDGGDDTIYGDSGKVSDLIVNGSFEDVTGTQERHYGRVGEGEVPGWTTADPNAEIDIHQDNRGGVAPADGIGWADLAASPGAIRLGQDVDGVIGGESYTLTFSAGDSMDVAGGEENSVTVYWGGQVIDVIDPPNDGTMQSYTYTLTGGAGDGSNRLEFEGTPGETGAVGASIDAISLVGPSSLTSDGDDVIAGGAGADEIHGEGGDDTITADDDGTTGDKVDGGKGSDRISAGGNDQVDGDEDADGKDIDVLIVNDVRQIDFRTDAGDPSPGNAVTENGTVTFNDGSTMGFENIESFVVDGTEFDSFERVPVHDAIQLAGPLPPMGETLDGTDFVAVDEPLQIVSPIAPDRLSDGDRVQIGEDYYTVTDLARTSSTVDRDDEYGIPDTSTGVEMIALTLSPEAGGADISYLVPIDYEGDLPEITAITPTAPYADITEIELKNPADNDIGGDDVVTLDGDKDLTQLYDLIRTDGFDPAADGILALDVSETNGLMVSVSDKVAVDPGVPGKLSAGDTANINGVEYTVQSIHEGAEGDVTHDDPATGAQTTTTDVPLLSIRFVDGDGNTLDFVAPADGTGDFPQISQIVYTSNDGGGGQTVTQTDIGGLDSDDIVTLETEECEPVHDLIRMSLGMPEAGNVYATGSGDLVAVDEPITFNLSPEGHVEPGATFVADGKTFEITETEHFIADITYDNGASVASDVDGYVVTAESSDGDTLHFTLPADDNGDLPNVTAIRYTAMDTTRDKELFGDEIDEDQDVSLAAPDAQAQLFDAIQLSDPDAPPVGETLTTEGGSGTGGESPSDLVSVEEPIAFIAQATPGTIGLSDTLSWNGEPVEVSGLRPIEAEFVSDNGTETGIEALLVEVRGQGGETTQFIVPTDADSPLPGIEQITISTMGAPQLNASLGPVKADSNVTLEPPSAGPAEFVLHDFLRIDDQPVAGGIKTVADDELVQVDEPLVFTTADPDAINTGDTTVLNGVTYTVTDTGQWKGTVTLDNGDTPLVKGGLLTLEPTGGGDPVTFAMPYDEFGDLPDITRIEFAALDDDAAPGIEQEHIDGNDFVTLICFAEDSHILTNTGEVKVQHLRPGDKVLTRDSGYQKIRWIGRTRVAGTGRFAPVTIGRGTFGNERDLRVSPQHRVLLCDWRAELMYGEYEVLVPARHLTNLEGINSTPCDTVEYFHILFDRHEVVFSEGIPTESFHPGDYALKGLGEESREELFDLFPDLKEACFSYGPSARVSLNRTEARQLIAELGLLPVLH